MNGEDAIRQILAEIPGGVVFDSHFVIQQLQRNDAYIDATADFAGGQKTTEPAHGHIAQLIAAFAARGELTERMGERAHPIESWSLNIHGTPSRCALWRRIPHS
jgi:hypothetical protein